MCDDALMELDNPDSEVWCAAAHESGHAVAAFLLQVPIQSLEITMDGNGGLETGLNFGDYATRSIAREGALVALAGPKTEEMLCPSSFCAGQPQRDDYMLASHHVFQIKDKKAREAFEARLEELINTLVSSPGFLDAVRKVAAHLIAVPNERKSLTGQCVTEIVREVLGDRNMRHILVTR
jgi:hypothetical protein